MRNFFLCDFNLKSCILSVLSATSAYVVHAVFVSSGRKDMLLLVCLSV